MQRAKRFKVGIFVDSIGAYGRGVTRGILAYQRYRRWDVSSIRTWIFQPSTFINEWSGDGLIAMLPTEQTLADVRRAGKPVVCVSSLLPELDPVSVGPDDLAVGAMVARHFIDRGFREFGFVANRDTPFTPAFIRDRRQGFADALREAGFGCESAERFVDLPALLQALTPPAALFAANDEVGIRAIEIAEEMGLRVPEQISVVGVDDDDLLVDSVDVSLSSVALPTFRIGFEAAALLDKIMSGETPPTTLIKLLPVAVTTRKSSDLSAISDPEVTAALAYIRQHAYEPIDVPAVVRDLPVSRRVLERRFQKHLQRSILEEIFRVRIERARHLLIETDLPVGDVIRACGFASRARFHAAFAKSTGMRPKAFRARHRHAGATIS